MMRHALTSLVVTATILAGCGGSGDDIAATPTTVEVSGTDTTDNTVANTSAPAPTVPTPSSIENTTTTEPKGADTLPNPFEEITVLATEAGPRPTLAWEPVDGAALYQLTVLDAAGDPYWSWSGEETSIPFGGVSNPDAGGAIVFEPMTWTVVARDANSQPLAMSSGLTLEP